MKGSSIFVVVLLMSGSLGADAQEPFDWVRKNEAGCRQIAAQVAAAPRPIDAEIRSLAYLNACGEIGGEVLAQQLLRLRTLTDTARMDDVLSQIFRIRDASVFEAAMELAADDGATIEGRVAGLRVLVEYHHPGRVTSFRYYMLPEARMIPNMNQGTQTDGTPLPANWEERARQLILSLMDDPSESLEVRYAAKRALF